MEATCAAGTKQEVTAGVEPGEPVAHGADGSGEGAGEGTLVSRLFSPPGPGSLAVTRVCSGLEMAKGCPGERRSWRSSRGLWQVAEEGGCSGPLCSTPRMSWRPRSAAPLCTAKGLFIHCFMVVCRGNEGSLGAKGSSSEVWSLPLPAAAGLGRPESGGAW